MLRHDAVRHFVKYDGSEEKEARQYADDPVFFRGPIRMLDRELTDERPGDEDEDDKPRGMNVDGDAGDGDDAESWTSGHHGFSGSRSSYF